MQKIFTLNLNHMLKRSLIFATMIGVVVIALASSGGGKKRTAFPIPVFTPLRSTGTFILKSRSDYAGSQEFIRMNDQNSILYKSVVTYQKGNCIYVLPCSYRIISGSKIAYRSNLNVLDLKIRLKK
jgi:hypothetical protein